MTKRYSKIELNGASVAITGAAQGIGRAAAEAFVQRGARVAIGDVNLEAAQRTAKEIGCAAYELDVTDPQAFARFIADASGAHGDIDVLVNNAGVMPNGGFLQLAPSVDRMTMEVNFFGVLNGLRAVLPSMVENQRGHIVNVASLAGKFAVPGLAVYNGSKFAVVGLTAALRQEYASLGVSLTAVLPSAVDTALSSGLDMRPIPKAKPEDIADAIVKSVRHRRAEVSVPGYVGGLATAAAVTPNGLLDQIRSAVRDDRAMAEDDADRLAYRAALEEQSQRFSKT